MGVLIPLHVIGILGQVDLIIVVLIYLKEPVIVQEKYMIV